MTDFLNTEELVQTLNEQNSTEHQHDKKHSKEKSESFESLNKKLKRNKIIYFGVCIIIALHIIYLVLPLVLPNNGLALYGMSNVLAVPIDQEVVLDEGSFEVYAAVVVIEKFNSSKLDIGDLVVIYGKFGSNVYWVERVVDFDLEQRTITTSLDGVFASNDVASFDQVIGFYVRMAGTTGALQFVSSNFRGFTLIVLIELIVLYGLYLILIDPLMQKIKKMKLNQLQDSTDIPIQFEAEETNKPYDE